jgi:hypothetical protein
MLMMKILGLILGQSYTTSTASTISSFSSSGDAATRDKLAKKALASREKCILTWMPTTDLILRGIAAVKQRQPADGEDKRNKKKRKAGAVR